MDEQEFEDYFESNYADDLDALRELEHETNENYDVPQAKRCLVYPSPKNSVKTSEDLEFSYRENEIIIDRGKKKRNNDLDLLEIENETNEIVTDPKRIKLDDSALRSMQLRINWSENENVLSERKTDVAETERLFQKFPISQQPSTETQDDVYKIWKRIPPGNFMPVTSESKQRVYLRVRSEAYIDEQVKEVSQNYHLNTSHLLGVPYSVVRHDAEVEREKKLIASSKFESQDSEEKRKHTENENGIELWVEKYKPRHYTELLSDDGINRVLLHWLKLWDKIVFGRAVNFRHKKETQNNNSFNRYQQKNKFKKNLLEINDELDEDGYPVKKLALLCGPPGLGKTTLAHILAYHAGYNLLEMNASDDRSLEVFRNYIEASTQMRAVFGETPKPNCLIIDEIDGAPAESINLLVSMALGKPCARSGKKRSKKEKNDVKPILRPIICICNDRYVPSLHQLRQNALVIVFPPTLASRLATRLQEILRQYKFKADMTALLALCEKTENDIRSCLSTLQFIHNRHQELRYNDIHSLSVGQKDVQKSLFSIWEDIFHKPKLNRKNFIYHQQNLDESLKPIPDLNDLNNFQMQDNTTLTSRFYNILNIVHSCGEYEKLFQGLFENYLNIKITDSYLDAVADGLEWLEFTDILNREIVKSQNYILSAYLPYCCVMFHLCFATSSNFRLTFPQSQYEFNNKLKSACHVLETLRSDMAPKVQTFAYPQVIVKDIFPYLLNIIHPTIRPVNTQLYTVQEKEELQHLIDVMIAYNLTYIQQLNQEGQYEYVLEPNIDLVSRFPGLKTTIPFSYASKQLIAHEIEREKMRRAEEKAAVSSRHTTEQQALSADQMNVKNNPVLELKANNIFEDKVAVDFFGRPIRAIDVQKKMKKPVDELGRGDIWFHFKEGYSNAVRRTIRIQDFL